MLSSGPVSVLESALNQLLPTCRAAEVAVIVVRVQPTAEARLGMAPGVEVMTVPAGTPDGEQRRQALALTRADIVTFVADTRALSFPWSDLLLQRAGLVRPGVATEAERVKVAP